MLYALPAPILLDIAIFFTALSWGLGLYLVDKKVYIFASLAVGCFVCLFGYSVESVGAPAWAVVAAPVPLDILLLWSQGRLCPRAAQSDAADGRITRHLRNQIAVSTLQK